MPPNQGQGGIRVLVVSPEQVFASSARQHLPEAGNFSIVTAETVGEAMATVTGQPRIDCIVSDHDLPETDGIAFLEAVRAHSPSLPFILFTSEGDEQVASRAITAGVTDYLIKERHADQWDRLGTLIRDAVRYSRTRQDVVSFDDRAETLLDNSHDLIAIVRDGRCTYINETGVTLLGETGKGKLVGKPISPWLSLDGDQEVEELVSSIEREAGEIDHREGTVIRGDNERIPVNVTATRVRWTDGPAAVVIARDVRERKALRGDLALKEQAIDEAPIGVTIADATQPDEPLVYVNDKLQEMTGYTEDELLGRTYEILQGPDTAPERIERLREATDAEETTTVELRNYRKDGTEFWNRVTIAPIRDEDGAITHYLGFQQDVTPEKEHERKLDRFMKAVEAAGHAIYMTGSDGEIFYVNPAFERITGYDESEAVGANPHLLQSGRMSDAYYEDLWETITGGDIWQEVIINRRKNGEPYHAEQTIAPITDRDGEITAYVAIQTDITERERMRRRTEIALEETQSLVFEIDIETDEVTRQGAVQQFFDVDPDEIPTRAAFEKRLVHPADQDRFGAFIDRLAAGATDYDRLDFRLQSPDGETRWLRSHAYRDSDRRIIGLARDITDQKEREETLQQYKQAVESSNDLLAAVDRDLNYIFANRTYREYHGVKAGDITTYALEDVLSEDAFETIRPRVETALAGETVTTEVTRTHPQMGDRILDVQLFPLEGSDATAIHGVGASMRDITEERHHQETIERESELRRLMSEVNHELVRSNDVQEALAAITSRLGETSEFTCTFSYIFEGDDLNHVCEGHGDLTDSAIEAIHTDAYIDAVFDAGLLYMEDVTEGEFAQHPTEMESHSGLGLALDHESDRYGILTVHFPPGEEPLPEDRAVLETIADDIGFFISNRLLRSEYKSFTEIVERIDDPVMLQDRDGAFQLINEAVADFAGLEKAALLGADESVFMDEAAATRVEEMKTRVLESGEPIAYQVTPTFPDGRERTFSTTRYPYYDEAGDLAGTIAICRDVTDLQEHQRQLRVLDRVLRHNVNNNMNVVQGYAEMIHREAAEPFAAYAGKIEENSTQLLDIAHKQRKITEFLSESDPVEQFDLVPILETVVDRIETEYPEARIQVRGPEQVQVRALKAIEEAVEELLTNCIIHADVEPEALIDIDAGPDLVTIQVRDTNDRIAPMDRDVIEGRTELNTLRHGSGLGLWLVKLIVDHSNGTLHYQENEPRGNVVTIELTKP